MQIIPAIDIIDGKCVRLTQGDFSIKKIYSENPLEIALRFEDYGISRLHLVDLDGAKKRRVIHWKVLEKIARHTRLLIDFGGGIQKSEDVKTVFDSGAYMATVGSIIVSNPNLFLNWIIQYGKDKFFIGVDVKNEKIAMSGWTKMTDISIWDLIYDRINNNGQNIFCTDIAKDGRLSGPSLSLYKKIMHRFPKLGLTASGGISTIKDLEDLKSIGCHGAIIGKAIYENKIRLSEIKKKLPQ